MVGTIIHLVSDKGFGFIQSDQYESNIFFHASALKNGTFFTDLKVGDTVNFTDAISGSKGLSTEEVEK